MTLRYCPAPQPGNLSCVGTFVTWDGFIRHIYDHHTEGSADARQMAVQRILAEGPGVREQQIVPKVTASPLTEALWRLSQDDRTAARRALIPLGPTERRAYLAQLTELINMLWEEL